MLSDQVLKKFKRCNNACVSSNLVMLCFFCWVDSLIQINVLWRRLHILSLSIIIKQSDLSYRIKVSTLRLYSEQMSAICYHWILLDIFNNNLVIHNESLTFSFNKKENIDCDIEICALNDELLKIHQPFRVKNEQKKEINVLFTCENRMRVTIEISFVVNHWITWSQPFNNQLFHVS